MRYTFKPATPVPVCREQIPWPAREDGTAASFTLEHHSVGAHKIWVTD